MLRFKTPATLLAAVLLCGLADADAIRMKDGTLIQGHATKYDADSSTLYWQADGGKLLELKLDDLNGRSSYSVLKGEVPKDSGPGQLQLANYARDVELFAHAVRHYGYAKQADPSLAAEVDAQVAILKTRAAKWGMAKAREAANNGDKEGALKWLQKVITKLPDQPEAAQAQQLIDDYYSSVKSEKTEVIDNHEDEKLKQELAKGKQAYDKMLEMNKRGLQSKSQSTSIRDWENAIKEGNKAIDEIDKFEKRNPDAHTEVLDGYRKTIETQIIEIYMSLASLYGTRSSYQKAQDQVNKALAIDPTDSSALAMRARIQDAASRGLGWW